MHNFLFLSFDLKSWHVSLNSIPSNPSILTRGNFLKKVIAFCLVDDRYFRPKVKVQTKGRGAIERGQKDRGNKVQCPLPFAFQRPWGCAK